MISIDKSMDKWHKFQLPAADESKEFDYLVGQIACRG